MTTMPGNLPSIDLYYEEHPDTARYRPVAQRLRSRRGRRRRRRSSLQLWRCDPLKSVESLVHGALFTRGPKDLLHTAVFVGGSNVAVGEAVLKKVCRTFFGPLRVSVMMDSNGSNTTAAAAVLSARKHLDLSGAIAVILAERGRWGLRAAQLLAKAGGDRSDRFAVARAGGRTLVTRSNLQSLRRVRYRPSRRDSRKSATDL